MKEISRHKFGLRTLAIAAATLTALIFGGAQSVWAQSPDPPSARQVFVGGTLFFTVRTTWAGLTPEQRADEIQQRINQALSVGPVYPEDITVGTLDGDWVVLFQGKRLFTADTLTAQADATAPKDLAEQWAAALRVQLPALTAPTGH